MSIYKIKSIAGESFDYEMPQPSAVKSFFPFALPKSGSSLLYKILASSCREAGVAVVDLPSESFEKGIAPKDLDESISQVFKPEGFAYLGWRYFPAQADFDFSSKRCLLLIRDPRDMMVSLYFSQAKSHRVPKKGRARDSILKNRSRVSSMDINCWAQQHGARYLSLFSKYQDHLPQETTRIYRYEDIIFRKREWLEDMNNYLGLGLNRQQIDKIADRHDIRPDKENPNAHVRQVTPGNYKKHFTPETIACLNGQFAEILSMYGYEQEIAENEPICFSDPNSSRKSSCASSGWLNRLLGRLGR